MTQDQMIIGSLMAEAETAVTEATQPSLSEAYSEGQNVGLTETPRRRREESQRNTALEQEEASARELVEADKETREKITVRRSPTLAEAHDGTEIEEQTIEHDAIPASLRGRFSADAISAAMNVLGLNEDDLQDERWQVILEQRLEEEAAANPEDEDEPNPETEESEEEKEDEQKPEVKDEATKPPVHVDLAPEDVKKYVDKTWERSQQVNSPQMTKLFSDSLATALGTPPEQRELLDNVVGLLNYGGTSLVQSAVPALVNEYMRENFVQNNHEYMRQYANDILEFAMPGCVSRYQENLVKDLWAETLAHEDFSGKGLPVYGTPEFSEAAVAVHAKNPWLENFEPMGADGKPMETLAGLRAKAAVTARLLVGERVDPKKIAQQTADAYALGKKSSDTSKRRVTASGSLGRGKTRSISFGPEGTDREGLMDAYKRGTGGGAI